MKILIPLFVAVIAALSYTNSSIAYAPYEPNELPKETTKEMVTRLSIEYGVNPALALHIVENESHWNEKARGDLHIICSNGRVANARGLWQITECYWPEVSDAQADDPEWSTRWSLEKLKEGKCSLWSTCNERLNHKIIR